MKNVVGILRSFAVSAATSLVVASVVIYFFWLIFYNCYPTVLCSEPENTGYLIKMPPLVRTLVLLDVGITVGILIILEFRHRLDFYDTIAIPVGLYAGFWIAFFEVSLKIFKLTPNVYTNGNFAKACVPMVPVLLIWKFVAYWRGH